MSGFRQINKAYQSAFNLRSQRDQDADVFEKVNGRLKNAQRADNIAMVKALADNGCVWQSVINANLDDINPQSIDIRKSLVTLGYAVMQEMAQPTPNIAFLININNNIAAGLRGVSPSVG